MPANICSKLVTEAIDPVGKHLLKVSIKFKTLVSSAFIVDFQQVFFKDINELCKPKV